ncbi:MAG: hypothetical protein K9G48_13865 [Reyranella sp.]|nr:hypothetical protein [Reyranella sp.]
MRAAKQPAAPPPVSVPPISKLDYRLYGNRADDVAFLKGIGCIVAPFRDDEIRVDMQVLDREQFAAKVAAERKRRQPGIPATAAKATPVVQPPADQPKPSTPPRAAISAPWRSSETAEPFVAVSLQKSAPTIAERVADLERQVAALTRLVHRNPAPAGSPQSRRA